MALFNTKIVRTWVPSKWLRTLGTTLLIASALSVFIWKPDIRWLMILSYVIYGITFLFALSLSFIKPKYLGDVSISEERIEIDFQGEHQIFLVSELEELGFDNRGYGDFWKYNIQDNKNHFYFTTEEGEKFDYEILVQNEENRENLRQFLKRIYAGSNKIGN